MQMNLDFCFMDKAHVVAVTGWTTQPWPQLRLLFNDDVLTPIAVTRHVRRDLRSSEPMGVVALFDLSGVSGKCDPEVATIHLAEGSEFNEIRNHRLSEDALRLVEIGVDEVFFALLRLIAQRKLDLSDERANREICARLRLASSAELETENHVLAVDRCQMTATGQGMVIGWFMSSYTAIEPLCALAIENEAIVPVDLLPASMARADLADYAPRYRFTGNDGYCGGWRFPVTPVGATRLLLMMPSEHFLPGVLVPVEIVPAAQLAQQVALASEGIDDIAKQDGLRRALLPARLPLPVVSLAEPEPTDVSDALLILDHDLDDSDLRDVLRHIGPHLPGRLRLQLLRPRLTSALQNAVDGAAREITARLALDQVSLAIVPPQTMPGRVVFARSSTLFQFDPAPLFDAALTHPRVSLLDPIGTVLATSDGQIERFIRDLLPFALSMPAASFFIILDQIPQCFLTEEARLRFLIETLFSKSAAEARRSDIHRFFEGRIGPHCQDLVDGRDWHTFDAESRQLIEEAYA